MGIQLGYAKIPYDEAARVTWYNTQDLFPGEQLAVVRRLSPRAPSTGATT